MNAPEHITESVGDSSAHDSNAETKRKKVLLVEDEPLTRLILMNEFHVAGIQVETASSGRHALVKLRRGYPDAIFIGLPLRDVDGLQLIKEIRRDSEFKDRPIYVCDSTFPSRGRSSRALDAGASKVFEKLATPMHLIIAEVLAHMEGRSWPAEPPAGVPSRRGASMKEVSGRVHEDLAELQVSLQKLSHCPDPASRAADWQRIHREVRSVVEYASVSGMQGVGRAAAVLEAFLEQICEKPNEITESSLHTIALAVEVLRMLAAHPQGREPEEVTDFLAVVVDADEVSNKSICAALADAGFAPQSFSDPAGAIEQLRSQKFDLIVLDVGMAAQNGLQLYYKFQELELNRETPIIFVTTPGGQHSQEVLSTCDTQFLVKPQSVSHYLEIALKALSRVLKVRLKNRPATSLDLQQVSTAQILEALNPPAGFPANPALGADSGESSAPDGQGSSRTEIIAQLEKSESELRQANEELHEQLGAISAEVEGHRGELSDREEERRRLIESDASLRSSNEELKRRIEEISADAALQLEALEKKESERSSLVDRVYHSDLELGQVRTALEQEAGGRKQLEMMLQELNGLLTTEQESVAEARKRSEDLESQLGRTTAELEQAKAELGRQLAEARAAADKAGADWKKETERGQGIEAELKALRQGRDELDAKLTGEQQNLAESQKRSDDLESKLIETTAELEQAKAELGRQLAEARAAADKAGADWKKETERSQGIEEELKALRQARDELDAKLAGEQQSLAESQKRSDDLESKLIETTAELEQAKADLGRQLAEARAATEKSGADWQKETERSRRIEEELKSLRQSHEALNSKLTTEQQGAAAAQKRGEELQGQLGRTTTELEQTKVDLSRQLAEARAAAEKASAEWQKETERSKQVEAELHALRQTRDELKNKLAGEHQRVAESRQRSSDLEGQLTRTNAELEQARLDLGKQLADARAAAEKAGSDWQKETERTKQVEDELQTLRQTRDELKSKLAGEQQSVADSRKRSADLEGQLTRTNTELEQAKLDLGKQLADARAAADKAGSDWQKETERTKQIEEELNALRQTRDELKSKLAGEQQSVAESRQRSADLEGQLTRTTAELEQAKADLGQQLSEARTAAHKAGTNWRKETERTKQIEEELNALRQTRDELKEKLAGEQQSVAESRKRSKDLQSQLTRTSAELEQAKADLGKQLADARAAAEKAGGDWQKETERSQQIEEELITLRQSHDALKGELTRDQRHLADSRKRGEELESRLNRTAAELERTRDESVEQLAVAKAAAERAVANWQKEAQRSQRSEAELKTLRDEIDGKLAGEQQQSAEALKRSEELEAQLIQSTVEFDQAKAELSRQLVEARAAAEKAGADWQTETSRRKQIEEELNGLRLSQEVLNVKLAGEQQSVAESRQRSEDLQNQLTRTSAELERNRAESVEQLSVANAATERAVADWQKQAQRSQRFEEELNALRLSSEELNEKLTAAHQNVAASQRHGEALEDQLSRTAADLEQSRTDLGRQLAEAQVAAEKAGADFQKEAERSQRFEAELAGLWQLRNELQRQASEAQHETEEARQQSEGLRTRLDESIGELQRVKTSLEQQTAERTRLESEHRALTESNAALNVDLAGLRARESAHENELSVMDQRVHEGVTSLARTTSELDAERGERRRIEQRAVLLAAQIEELHGTLSGHLQSEKEQQERTSGLERQLREREEIFARSTADLEGERGERRRIEQRAAALSTQLQKLHEELSGHLQAEKEHQERTTDLERQLREREEAFARSATDLESERGERRRVEQRTTALSAQLQELHEKLQAQLQVEKDHQGRIGNLERQLQDRQGELERLDDALRTEKADRHLAEEQLEAAGELASRLQQYQGAFEETRSGFARAREEMQTRLQDSLNALNESEARWKKEVAERQRLVDALEAAQRDHRLQSQESAAQLASLQSNLQAESMERRRMESEAAHSRFASLGSARSGRTQIQDLRKRVQQPVEGLMRSSRQLLELELREEQKKVAESLHENILLLQKRLQETDSVGASSTRSDSPVPGETSLPTEPRNAVDAAS